MLYLSKQSNALGARVESSGLGRKVRIWESIDSNDSVHVAPDFPKMTEELRGLTLGVYQIKLAKLYTQEHLDEEWSYQMYFNQDEPSLLCAKIQSRHTSSKQYKIYIYYIECGLQAWYCTCTCRSGTRVVGMCSHCSSVIWYLSYARHQDKDRRAQQSWFAFVDDASKQVPEEINAVMTR